MGQYVVSFNPIHLKNVVIKRHVQLVTLELYSMLAVMIRST